MKSSAEEEAPAMPPSFLPSSASLSLLSLPRTCLRSPAKKNTHREDGSWRNGSSRDASQGTKMNYVTCFSYLARKQIFLLYLNSVCKY
ncbi:Hla Class I Histocompatibility Antigen, A Alpha Chain [Manis pentadactyla]|nr:Hla Class I Histocompatibility Antigen, A Alpha Chain [Manis pentadactyla]